MFGLGTPELIILLVIVLILFGGAKVPQMMKGLGEGMKEFRKATQEEEPKIETQRNETHRTVASSEESQPHEGSDKNA